MGCGETAARAPGWRSVWTDERVERLKKFWAGGLSAGDIAAKFNPELRAEHAKSLSRNAVISKVRRLGLPYRAQTTLRHKRSPKSLTAPRLGSKDEAALTAARTKALAEFNAAMAASEPEVPTDQRLTILARDAHGRLVANDRLTERCCRWPIGDPGTESFHFCGAPKDLLGSYCPEHHARAFVQVPSLPYLPPPVAALHPTLLEAGADLGDMAPNRAASLSRVEEALRTTH